MNDNDDWKKLIKHFAGYFHNDKYIEKYPDGNLKFEIENGVGKKYYPCGLKMKMT